MLRREIVPIEEWIESYYYLGPEARTLYPFWKQHIIRFFNEGKLEFIFHGSYSLGKTHIALIMILRVLYEISCFENFPGLFELSSASKVMLAFISKSARKARSSGIGKLIRMFDSIPYFQDCAPRRTDTDSVLDLGFVEVVYGSNVGHLIAEDFYGVVFDEANFVNAAEGDEFDKAQKIFLEARIRGASRFSIEGKQYGFFGLLSSANTETSFTESRIEAAKGDDDIMVVEAATYDVKPQAYSKERFQVFTGIDDIEPFIVDEVTEDRKGYVAKTYGILFEQFLSSHPEQLIMVPESLRKFYQEDILYSLKSLSGRTVKGTSKLLRNQVLLTRTYEGKKLTNPILKNPISLSLFADDTAEDFIDVDALRSNYEEGCKLFVHFDLSKSGDATGFGFCYKSESTGRFVTPIKGRISKVKESDEIDYSKIEQMIYFIVDTLEAPVGFISTDQYGHQYIGQQFQKRFGRDKYDVISADKDDSYYLMYLFLLKKGLVDDYYDEHFVKNFLLLNHDKGAGKVDHPEGATKDISDAVVVSHGTCYRFNGLSREEIVAAQFQTGGFYEETTQDLFYQQLMDGARRSEESGFYADIIKSLA